ncbi:MAG: CDP-diacylglycerol--serine O-phosphatidyltransferase [Planctomycetes bacterium]|nr:CDP-diacylglycerol--serine O-phosphatidyltransferase [Planctomycetota bacterium]
MRIPRVAILPSLCTLGNALCGFAAITMVARALIVTDEFHKIGPSDVRWAGYFVILAMVFDALDGRIARFARATTDFGGQLDSVADVVSFGVAPAFLMNRVVVESLRDVTPEGLTGLLRLVWVCAAVYLGCALIRLARFNVENVHEEEAHMSFKGLPSPAAAGALVSLVIVLGSLLDADPDSLPARILLLALPVVTAVLGLLMVSKVRYSHMLNQFLRGRKPVSHLVLLFVGIIVMVALKEVALVVGFGGYALSGPVAWVWRRARRGRAAGPGSYGPPPPVGGAGSA